MDHAGAKNRVLGSYRVVYRNGGTQVKTLITQDDFARIMRPKLAEAHDLESLAYEIKKKDRRRSDELKAQARAIKKELTAMFGEHWFTDGSPLFEASRTGVLSLPPHQGGDQPCTVELIN